MRALRIWTEIVEWRWTPAVGLALGALSYVSLALLVIPDQIGDEGPNAKRSIGTFQSLRNRTSAFAASIAPSLTDSDAQRDEAANSNYPPTPSPPSPTPVDDSNFRRRGFSPPLERVEAPVPAPPPPEIVVPVPAPQPPPQAEAPPAPPPAPAEAPPAPPPVPPPAPAHDLPPQPASGAGPETPAPPAGPAPQ